jgi:hypothetical protein
MIGSRKQDQVSSMLLPGHYTGDGSIFSVHITRVPPQAICRLGPKFQEHHQIRQRLVTKYTSSKGNTTFEGTVKTAKLF